MKLQLQINQLFRNLNQCLNKLQSSNLLIYQAEILSQKKNKVMRPNIFVHQPKANFFNRSQSKELKRKEYVKCSSKDIKGNRRSILNRLVVQKKPKNTQIKSIQANINRKSTFQNFKQSDKNSSHQKVYVNIEHKNKSRLRIISLKNKENQYKKDKVNQYAKNTIGNDQIRQKLPRQLSFINFSEFRIKQTLQSNLNQTRKKSFFKMAQQASNYVNYQRKKSNNFKMSEISIMSLQKIKNSNKKDSSLQSSHNISRTYQNKQKKPCPITQLLGIKINYQKAPTQNLSRKQTNKQIKVINDMQPQKLKGLQGSHSRNTQQEAIQCSTSTLIVNSNKRQKTRSLSHFHEIYINDKKSPSCKQINTLIQFNIAKFFEQNQNFNNSNQLKMVQRMAGRTKNNQLLIQNKNNSLEVFSNRTIINSSQIFGPQKHIFFMDKLIKDDLSFKESISVLLHNSTVIPRKVFKKNQQTKVHSIQIRYILICIVVKLIAKRLYLNLKTESYIFYQAVKQSKKQLGFLLKQFDQISIEDLLFCLMFTFSDKILNYLMIWGGRMLHKKDYTQNFQPTSDAQAITIFVKFINYSQLQSVLIGTYLFEDNGQLTFQTTARDGARLLNYVKENEEIQQVLLCQKRIIQITSRKTGKSREQIIFNQNLKIYCKKLYIISDRKKYDNFLALFAVSKKYTLILSCQGNKKLKQNKNIFDLVAWLCEKLADVGQIQKWDSYQASIMLNNCIHQLPSENYSSQEQDQLSQFNQI